MNKIIGRVADAVLDDLCDRKGIKHELNAVKYDDPEIWEEIREAVGRAALTALREPTPEMNRAGGNEPVGHAWASSGEYITDDSAGDVFRAMVDAALADETEDAEENA